MHEIISKLKFRHFSAVKSLDVKMSDFYELAELENDGLIYGFMMINHALINLYDMWLFLQHSTPILVFYFNLLCHYISHDPYLTSNMAIGNNTVIQVSREFLCYDLKSMVNSFE